MRAADNNPPIQIGERGVGVGLIRVALEFLGYNTIMPHSKASLYSESIFGEELRKTLRVFQKACGITEDGIAGSNTIKALDDRIPTQASIDLWDRDNRVRKLLKTADENKFFRLGVVDPPPTPNPSAGRWNSQRKEAKIIAFNTLLRLGFPAIKRSFGQDASGHLEHYLENVGSPKQVALERMLSTVRSARADVEALFLRMQYFVEALPPGTYEFVSINRSGGNIDKSDSENWHFATGSYEFWFKGKVRTFGLERGSPCTMKYELKYADRYNFDKGKVFIVRGIEIKDETLGKLHLQGFAREFDMFASLKRELRWNSGSVLSKDQYLPPDLRKE